MDDVEYEVDEERGEKGIARDKKNRDTVGRVIITQEQISRRAAEIGRMIEEDFEGQEVVLVGILKGAVMWIADIMKNVNLDVTIDFMALSSYGSSTRSSGIVQINKDLDADVKGRNVIIIEDIVDRAQR